MSESPTADHHFAEAARLLAVAETHGADRDLVNSHIAIAYAHASLARDLVDRAR